MCLRSKLLASLLAALLSVTALACQGGELEGGDPLEDAPGTQADDGQAGNDGGY